MNNVSAHARACTDMLRCLLSISLCSSILLQAAPLPTNLLGAWSLDLESRQPAWMRIIEENGKQQAYLRVYVGSEGPYEIKSIENGRIQFDMRKRKKTDAGRITVVSTVDVGVMNGQLDGVIKSPTDKGDAVTRIHFTGTKISSMPKTPPDLTRVRFGNRITLFNGKDLTGWRPYESNKIMGWSVEDGLLVNNTPKTDFSATGAYANLRTVEEFEDFRLHIEFLVGKDRNSGVYLRGMYEAQVVDRDSRMQGLQGVGAIFSRIAPAINAGKPGGAWQTYDITLLDRHVTVILNGVKVIDNQPVIGPTGGAIYTNPDRPGPIYLQGDHTSVKYRNIYLEPVLK